MSFGSATAMLDPIALAAGTALPDLERTIELPDMVAYAGATWDWHRLHYDSEYAASRGIPAPIVDGQVLGAYLAAQLTDAFGPRCFIRRLEFRFRSMVFAGDTITCSATVTSVTSSDDGIVVGVEQKILVGDRVVVAPAGAEGLWRV